MVLFIEDIHLCSSTEELRRQQEKLTESIKSVIVKDKEEGYVAVQKYTDKIQSLSGIMGSVISRTCEGTGGCEVLITMEDIKNNIESINRINRISNNAKTILTDFLKTFKENK